MKTADELNDLRKRVLAGEEFDAPTYREIIQSYRAARLAGVSATAPKIKAKATAAASSAPADLQTLLAGLGLPKKG